MFEFKLAKSINISNRIQITLTYYSNIYFKSQLYTTKRTTKRREYPYAFLFMFRL